MGGVGHGVAGRGRATTVDPGDALLAIARAGRSRRSRRPPPRAIDLDAIRPTSPRSSTATTLGLDAARPDAVERRRRTGQRTARENVDDLVRRRARFVEYGSLVVAAQRRRRTLEELIERTPADGLVGGRRARVDGRPDAS